MLLVAEGIRIDRSQPAQDRERGDLRLSREPVLDRGQMRVQLRGHAHARLVLAFHTPVRRANLASACTRCERACEGERVCRAGISCRRKPPPSNALAQLVLAPTDYGGPRPPNEIDMGLA